MAKKKINKKFRLTIKISLCIIYLIIISILTICAFKLYEKDQEIVKWKDVSTTKQYSYISISEMSETFAVINDNKQIHFVIEQEETGEWHTYLIAIDKKDYSKYKNIIDYTYERTTAKPKTIKVYGYPIEITKNIKSLAIKNVTNFVPIENQVVLDNKNFEQYMTNTYLDTTIEKTHETNYIVVVLLVMALVLIILLIFTLFDKDKIVDEVDIIIEKENEKLLKEKKKSKKKVKSNKKDKTTNNKTKKKKAKSNKKETQKKDEDIEVI